MTIKDHNRQYDLVVLGATGYSGKLTAEHIAKALPTTLKWALSGRSEGKLQAVIDGLREELSDRSKPSVELVNIDSLEELRALAKKTYVFITTVGPYAKYGEKAFRACAEVGTHYLDVTGEAPWTARMIKKYSETAKTSGAIMFPQIGIESAPPDLCTWVLGKHLRETAGVGMRDVTISIHTLRSAPSGGTLATVFGAFDNISLDEFRENAKPFSISPIPHTQLPLRPSMTLLQSIFGIRYIKNLGLTTTSIAAAMDTPIVERSWGLLSTLPSRKDEFYGPNFHWREVQRAHNWLHGIAQHFGLLVGGIMLALFPWVRALAKRSFYQPGEGRTKDQSAHEELEYRGLATPDKDGETQQAFVKATFYAGGIYYLTGVFLGQAALTLLEDDVGLEGGIYTPACLGQRFIDRCGDAGFKMEVKTIDN